MFINGVSTLCQSQFSFSTTASLATARQALGASGPSSSSALAFGGYSTTTVNVSEEFTGETTAVNLKAFG